MKKDFKRILFCIIPFWLSYIFIFGEYLFIYILSFFDLDKLFYLKPSPTNDFFFIFSAVILSPLIEEFFFRYPLKFFKNKIVATIIFSLVFTFLHKYNFRFLTNNTILNSLFLLPIFNASIVLSYIRLKYGFYFGLGMHALYNILVLILIY